MELGIRFRWLGVAGIELAAGGEVLAIDPFFSRFPFWRMWLGRVQSDRDLVAEHLPHCDVVLVTHTHFDHVLDVPDVVRNTGALALGSHNTCRVLEAAGIPRLRYREVHVGDRLSLGRFQVTVLPGAHAALGGRPILAGEAPQRPASTLGARDYRMDECYSYLIEAAGLRLLDWANTGVEGAERADVLCMRVTKDTNLYRELSKAVQPRVIIPIHWDDLFRPLSQPLRPAWHWPLLQRIDMERVRQTIQDAAPGVRVWLPEFLTGVDLADLIPKRA